MRLPPSNMNPALVTATGSDEARTLADWMADVNTYIYIQAASSGSRQAIQDAINTLNGADGGTVILGPGDHMLDGDFILPKTGAPVNIRGVGNATVLKGLAGFSGPYISIGDQVTGGGMSVEVTDLAMTSPVSGTYSGIDAYRFNAGRLARLKITAPVTGIGITDTYGLTVDDCIVENASSAGFYAATACHNLKIRGGGFFTCASYGVFLDVEAFNVLIEGTDFEVNGIGIRADNQDSLAIKSCYIENCVTALFDFNACRSVSLDANFLGLSPAYEITGIDGGYISNTTLLTQTITVDTTGGLTGFDVGNFYSFGVGKVIVPQPWLTPTLINSWAQHANQMPVGYRRDSQGTVYLRGGLINGTASTIAFTLPAGYRPAGVTNFACTGGGGANWVQVQADGDVLMVTAPTNSGGLNGIFFEAAA